jgi:hypothetical protein
VEYSNTVIRNKIIHRCYSLRKMFTPSLYILIFSTSNLNMDLEPKNTVNSWILCHAGVDFYQLDKWKNALIYMYLMAQERMFSFLHGSSISNSRERTDPCCLSAKANLHLHYRFPFIGVKPYFMCRSSRLRIVRGLEGWRWHAVAAFPDFIFTFFCQYQCLECVWYYGNSCGYDLKKTVL